MTTLRKRSINRQIVEELLEEGEKLNNFNYDEETEPQNLYLGNWAPFKSWGTSVVSYLSTVLKPDNQYLKSLTVLLTWSQCTGADLITGIATLKRLLTDIDRGVFGGTESSIDALTSLSIIFNRFHQVAKQLRKRHDGRLSFDIQDEYDVQDLLYALLQLYFDDIESEEYVPKYAGKGSRCDFALRDHNIIIEAKKTRAGLKDKEIGEELTLDIAKYSKYPNLKHLICFVYDPDGYVRNLQGLERDIAGDRNGLDVQIFIRPK